MAASRPADPRLPQNHVPPDPKGSRKTASRRSKGIRKHASRRRTKPHTPYSVCPPMNSLMIDVGGIAAISSGESATI